MNAKKLFRLFALVLSIVLAFPTVGHAQSPAKFSVTGAPSSVKPNSDPAYKNTINSNTQLWLGEPGVLTGDPGDENCKKNASCWEITPDRQQKLTGLGGQGFDIREDGWLMFTLAKGKFEVEKITIEVSAQKDHTWFVIFRGKNPGEGDLNTPVKVTDYDAGFGLGTNLPVGARISENYFLQNVKVAHTKGNCGNDGCKAVSAIFYDLNTGLWTAVTQNGVDGKWELLGSNASK